MTRRDSDAPSPMPVSISARSPGHNWLGSARQFGQYAGLLLVLAAMLVFFSLSSDYFLSMDTFSTLANQIPSLTVMAVGMTLVMVSGGIDLSVGSVLALAGGVLSLAMVDWGWGFGAAAALSLAVGLGCGLINGVISVAWSVPSFIVTLGMLEVARGSAYVVTGSRTKYVGDAVAFINEPLVLGISPAFMIALAVVVLGQLVLARSVFGRHIIGIGTNEQAMRMAGLGTGSTRIAVFALLGLLAALAAAFQVSRLEAADPNAAAGMELQVIAAVVIGGTSLMGGRGSVINTFIGVLIIAVLEAGLAQIGASDPAKRIITGVVIVIAVIADMLRHRGKRGAP